MKGLIKKILGERLVLMYHFVFGWFAAIVYGHPSRKMVLIGVTGTKGKTSTVNHIWAALQAGGIKTGVISTVNVRIDDVLEVNTKHMTMPGRLFIQRTLHRMLRAGCTHVIVETTSEGIKQHRARFIDFSVAVFTNLSPEHLESHGGSMREYKEAKGRLFAGLSKHKGETLAIVNADSEYASYFRSFPATLHRTFSVDTTSDCKATDVVQHESHVTFNIESNTYTLNSIGTFNVYNALPAILIAQYFGVSDADTSRGLRELGTVPGRMDEILETRSRHGYRVFVDYAHEPASLSAAIHTSRELTEDGGKVIVITGSQGGGRDHAKRALLGATAAELADYCIIANEDPYDDDPKEIIEDVARGAVDAGSILGKTLFTIEDRAEAIAKALSLACKGDVVLIAGKGAEQNMIIKGEKVPWNDKTTVQNLLN